MRNLQRACISVVAISALLIFHLQSFAAEVPTRYTWMLPKTVIDATVTYTFEDCSKNNLKVKITPTLIGRAIPDPLVGPISVDTDSLQSFWQDKNISVQTFAGSHILSSIGSNPTSQVAQIGANILGAIAKIVAIGLGVPVVPALAPEPPTLKNITCLPDTDPDSAQATVGGIKKLKQAIANFQKELSNGVDEATQKKNTAAIQAAQTLISTLQEQLTITIKTTIDPGISPVNVNPDNDMAAFRTPTQSSVAETGLVATICPSANQLKKAKWFAADDVEKISAGTKNFCAATPLLQVNVYLDFPNGHGTMFGRNHEGPYRQTNVFKKPDDDKDIDHIDLYRDVGYIPVLVWRGEKPTKPVDPTLDAEGSPTDAVQLIRPQSMPFGQFGVSQSLQFSARAFKNLTWQISFLENGEITTASFASKSQGVGATAFFGSAASAANSIATEERNATSSSSRATALQSQADLIYQTHRLELCQTTPANCPK